MTKYDLFLTGTVGWSISTGYVKYVLDGAKDKPVKVAISSLGGFVDTGLQIYELFKNHGNVTVEFLGMSASAATFMAMGAKEVKMAKNALILIHNSAQWIDAYGNKNKEQIDELISRLKFQRDQLSTIDDVLAQIYADRNGKTVDEVKAKMKVAAWIKAEDAKEFGIVDEVIESVSVKDATPSNRITNAIINDMGLPELPKGFDLETGEESPAESTFQKAMEMLKGLFTSTFAANDQKMIKIFTSVMALLSITDGFQPNEQGDVTLTQDQMKKIDDELKAQNDACKQAKGVIDTLKAQLKAVTDEKDALKTQVDDLKKGPGERKSNAEEVNEENTMTGAAELFNSIKEAL